MAPEYIESDPGEFPDLPTHEQISAMRDERRRDTELDRLNEAVIEAATEWDHCYENDSYPAFDAACKRLRILIAKLRICQRQPQAVGQATEGRTADQESRSTP